MCARCKSIAVWKVFSTHLFSSGNLSAHASVKRETLNNSAVALLQRERSDQRTRGSPTDFLCVVTAAVILADPVTLFEVDPSSCENGESQVPNQTKYELPHSSTVDTVRDKMITYNSWVNRNM